MTIAIHARREEVLAATQTSGGLETWFLKSADFLNKSNEPRRKSGAAVTGDEYWFQFVDGTTEIGSVIESSDRGISFSFGKGVAVTLTVEGENPVSIHLTETIEIQDEAQRQKMYVSTLQGWTFYMTNLKSVVENGADLREREVFTHGLVNA